MDCPRHDVAWPAALSILSVFEDVIREDEHRDALHEIYIRVVAALEAYDMRAQRLLQQTEPGEN